MSQRGLLLSSPSQVPNTNFGPGADSDLQDHLNYIRENMYVRGEPFERSMTERRLRRRRRHRRRRGGRYARMKKLTEEQVQLLFPKQTYHLWLNGGQAADHENRGGVLQEEQALRRDGKPNDTDSSIEPMNSSPTTNDEDEDVIHIDEYQQLELERTKSNINTETITSTKTNSNDINNRPILFPTPDIELNDLNIEEGTSSALGNELHFTSGSCAICLDLLEDESLVRGLVCGHVFHSDCLDPWLTKRRACCPMCKRDYFYKDENNNSLNRSQNEPSNPEEPSNSGELPDGEQESDDDTFSLDFDSVRNDPTLRAMLRELIPVNERVRLILQNPEVQATNIETEAKSMVEKKFSNFLKKTWWKVMGISRENLFNWAVLLLYKKFRANQMEQSAQSESPLQQEQQPTVVAEDEPPTAAVQDGTTNNNNNRSSMDLVPVNEQLELRDIVDQRV